MEPENDEIISELSAYLSENGGIGSELPYLTRRQEIRLARRVEQGDKRASEILINAHLRLVIAIAQRYHNDNILLEDLIQEGTLGLVHAVDKYDHRRGFRLLTFATYWIRQSIGRYVKAHGSAEPPIRLFHLIGRRDPGRPL